MATSRNPGTPPTRLLRFHLKSGVFFHDGHPLTSADVKSTFDFILNPANKSPNAAAFAMIARIEAPDPRTAIFHLKRTLRVFFSGTSFRPPQESFRKRRRNFFAASNRHWSLPIRQPIAG